MVWYDLFDNGVDKGITYVVLVLSFGFILYRNINIALVSLASAAVLIGCGILSPWTAITQSIDWNVIAIYWGYGMLAFALRETHLPAWLGQLILRHAKKEKSVLILLCTLAAGLSAFMANPVVVIILAPLFIHIAEKFDGDLFLYLIGLAISSNVVTTVTMVADPPALIMASKTNMRFLDFYWFQGKLGLGTISVFGIIAALLILLVQFRRCNKTVSTQQDDIKVTSFVPLIIFLLSVSALSLPTGFPFWTGLVGISVGLSSLWQGDRNRKAMLQEFDWNSVFFLLGIFILVSAVDRVGILKDLAERLAGTGMKSASLYLAAFVWLSVLLSSFIDNVPYTILMLPVCSMVAQELGIDPYPFYFGMLVGTGIGGNVTPVGATANVLACGMLEQRGYRIDIRRYLAMSLPFSLGAVLVCHAMIQIFWL